MADTILAIKRLLAWLRETDWADVGHLLEGGAHEQEGEVVVVVVHVQVGVFLHIIHYCQVYLHILITNLNPVHFELLEGILLVLGLRVPLAAPHEQDVLECVRVVDAVARGEHHLRGNQRGSTQINLYLVILQYDP